MINICIIGCGEIAATHADHLRGSANLFFHSRNIHHARKLNRVKRGHGVYAEYGNILADPDLKGVVICTPPDCHAELAIQALDSGKSVLVEKPLGESSEEINRIRLAALRNPDTILMVAENYLYKPSFEHLNGLVGRHEVGQLQEINLHIGYREPDGGWRDRYGALFECGVHFISQISALMKYVSPERVEAEFPNWRKGMPERTSIVRMEYPGGTSSKLCFSWEQPGLPKGILQCSQLKGDSGEIRFESNGLFGMLKRGTRRKFFFPGLRDVTGRRNMAADFIACLENPGRKPVSDLESAAHNLEIIFKAYRSQGIPAILT